MQLHGFISTWFLLAQLSLSAPTSDGQKFENALCKTKHPDITPLDKPVITYQKAAVRKPHEYLKPRDNVFGKEAAEWQAEFFDPAGKKHGNVKFANKPQIEPIRPGAPTIVSIYYPHPDPSKSRSKDTYLARLKNLAMTGEQVVIYVAKEVSADVKKMRKDVHWHVIDDYATVWDIPNNKFQKENFEKTQPGIFAKMLKTGTDQWKPNALYNDPFYSAVYNAKAFITFDAPLRNPFGSDRWVYMDAGLLVLAPDSPSKPQPPSEHGKPWDMLTTGHGFLDDQKIDRSIRLTKNTGVVFPEYTIKPYYGAIDVSSKAFTDPLYQWQNRYYLGGLFVGDTLGMLNYAVRYMQTIDTLDANGRYTGREEFVTPIVGAMYPNTVFSQPVQSLPPQLKDPKYGDTTLTNWKFMLLSYSTPYGKSMLPEMRDPIAGLLCTAKTGYVSPRGELPAGKP